MLALCRTTALQCGHIRVAPKVPARATLIVEPLVAAAHQTRFDLHFLILPAEFDVPAQPRAGRHRNRPCLHIADDDAPFLDVDPLGGFDVALKFAADHHDAGEDLTGQMGPVFHGEIAVDAHIALEAAGNTHVARALDLTLDGEVCRDNRFPALRRGFGSRAARRDGQRRITRTALGRAPLRGWRRRRRGAGRTRGGGHRFFVPKRHELTPIDMVTKDYTLTPENVIGPLSFIGDGDPHRPPLRVAPTGAAPPRAASSKSHTSCTPCKIRGAIRPTSEGSTLKT